MSVQQVDTTFSMNTAKVPGGVTAEYLADFLAQLCKYDNSFTIHEFTFKISYRTIWMSVEEANLHVHRFIQNVMRCLGETYEIEEDQVQIDYNIDGRDISKEMLDLIVTLSSTKGGDGGFTRTTSPFR